MSRRLSFRKDQTSWLALVSLCLILLGGGLAGFSGIRLVAQQMAYHSYKIKKPAIELKTQAKDNTPVQADLTKLNHLSRLKAFTSQVHYSTVPELGTVVGQLEIPKLTVNLPIVEGANPDQLAKGVGHFQKSGLPGQSDNCVLSGHRDTVFRELGKLKIGDKLIVKTKAGTFVYRITKFRIVDQNDRTVIVPTQLPTLTLTTCYPFHYIGNAPKRYILTAHLQPKKSQVAP